MREIIFQSKILILFYSVFIIETAGAQNFEVYKSWDFENETLGEYTDSEIREDFDVYHLYSHNVVDIVEDIINNETTKVLRVEHTGGVLNYGLDLQAGLGNDYDELYMSYNFKFSNEFNSTSGGKLPGFCGWWASFPADQYPNDTAGFVIKNMYKQAGRMITYHYDRTTGYCPWGNEAYNYDSIFFNNGCWYNITRRLVMNTFTDGVANSDGIHEVWVDGRLIFKETGLKIMVTEGATRKIDGIHIAHWYGGDGVNYTPLTTCYGYIDNIKVWIPVNDPTLGTYLTHDENEILNTPDKITDRTIYYDLLRNTTGRLQNSEYGHNYSSCIDEAYLIDAGEGKHVVFTIEAGTIGGGDYLFFYDGNQTDSHIIDVISGYNSSFTGTRESKGRYMFVRFSSNQDEGSIGWTGTISFEEGNNDFTDNTPPVIENQEFIISEESFNGHEIGQLEATENDPGQSITFEIIAGNESGLFSLDAQSGELNTVVDNIFELEPDEYSLTVKVTDDGDGFLSDEATISVILDKLTNIVYIDPDNKNDALENGSIQHPFDSWQDIEWTSGFNYRQKRGTVATESKISILASDISIGAYGEGDLPVIWSTAEDYALSFFEKSDITIQKIHVVAENAISSVYFLGDIVDNIIIQNSTFEGSIYGIRILGGKNFIIKYNTFRSNSEAVYSYAESTRVHYNIFQNNQDALHIDGENSSAEIYNNVFYDNNTAITNQFSELTLYNNIFYLTKDFDKALNFYGTELISDYNIFYPPQESFVTFDGQDFSDLSEFQQIEGIDANSFVSDPLFVDAFRHNFSIKSGSPAIDAGIYVGITTDLIGESVPYGNNPDIGVIETNEIANSSSVFEDDEILYPIHIYPNPSDGIFNISFEELKEQQANVNIRDMNGHTIFEKQYSEFETQLDHTLDISDFPSGIYILTLQLASTLYSLRIFKIF